MKHNDPQTPEKIQESTGGKVTFLEDGTAAIPSERERKKRRGRIRSLAVLGALMLVVISALCVTAAAGWLSAERISLYFYDSSKGKTAEENLPLVMNGLKVSHMDNIGYCFGVLDDRKYTIYSPACNLLYTYTHNMSSPVTVTSERRVLLYERGNYTATVFNRKGVLWSKTMEKEIISADMNKKNRVILATGSERYLSEVVLLNKEGEEIQTWYSSERYAVDVAVSPDGNSFAVALIRVVNGDEQAMVSLFRTGETGPREEYEFNGETIYDLRYLSDGTLMAVGTSTCAFFNDEMEMTGTYPYGTQSLSFFTNTKEHAVLFFAPEAGETTGTVLRLNTLAEEVEKARAEEAEFLTVDPNGRIYLCERDAVRTIEWVDGACQMATVPMGEEIGEVIQLLPTGDKTLILSIGGIYAAGEEE